MAMTENTRRTYPKFSQYVLKKLREHGDKFSMADLDMRFVPYYESGERIKVKSKYGDVITGTVGVTTGWRPVFLLIRRRNSFGSSDTLGPYDEIIGVQVGRRYYPPHEISRMPIPKKSDFK